MKIINAVPTKGYRRTKFCELRVTMSKLQVGQAIDDVPKKLRNQCAQIAKTLGIKVTVKNKLGSDCFVQVFRIDDNHDKLVIDDDSYKKVS